MATSSRDFVRPRGDVTTVIDYTDRDLQDEELFPNPGALVADISWFAPDNERRTIHFSPQIQTFVHRGPAQFGGRFTFEIDKVSAGDLIHMVALQVNLGHWLPQDIQQKLLNGQLKYVDPNDAWTYVNGIGRSLIESAEFQVDDTTIETIDTVAADCILKLFPDINTTFGFGRDGSGTTNLTEQIEAPTTSLTEEPNGMFDPRRPFTVDRGQIYALVPFFFTRQPYRGSFPLLAVNNNGRVRFNFNLRPFEQLVRKCDGQRASCTDSPLNKTFHFINDLVRPPINQSFTVGTEPPPFKDIKMIVYSSIVGDEVRQNYIRNEYEIIYRSIQPFPFSEPLKYAVVATNSDIDSVRVQLPLEFNHPIEELFWVIRRKAINVNNDWLNFTSYTEKQLKDNGLIVRSDPLIEGTVYINSIPVAQKLGQGFRQHIASRHLGGIIPYSSFIYGYSFAKIPGALTPTGTINASRTSSIRLDLTVRVPQAAPGAFTEADEQTWEILVYGLGINWLRFQNGMCARIYAN